MVDSRAVILVSYSPEIEVKGREIEVQVEEIEVIELQITEVSWENWNNLKLVRG